MRRPKLNAMCLFTLMGWGFLVSGSSLLSASEKTYEAPKSVSKTVTLNGVKVPIPKGYALLQGNDVENTIFFFHKKYSHGLFVSVPSLPFDENQLLNGITRVGLSKFFPNERQTYTWTPLSDRRKVSKFEVGGDKAMGYNKSNLIIVQAHHFRVGLRDLLIGDIFELNKGKEAEESFNRGLGGESMQGCNVIVEIIYSITGEEINETNSPCELIALPPTN
jgi:hypothetical protein